MLSGKQALLVQKKGSLEEGPIKGAKLEFCALFLVQKLAGCYISILSACS